MRIAGGKRLALGIAVIVLTLGAFPVNAQSKKSAKQAENLAKSAESAKASMQKALDSVGKLHDGYNSIIDGTAKNPQSTYKKLVGLLKDTQKEIDRTQKQVQAMNKEAGKFFAAWESDLNEISNEDLRQKSQTRLDASKAKYETLGQGLSEARDLFAPMLQGLNDQVVFLGRDLSPEAIADLTDEAAALNEEVRSVSEQVSSLLASADSAEAAAEGAD